VTAKGSNAWDNNHKAGTGHQAIGHRQVLMSAINEAYRTGNQPGFSGFSDAAPHLCNPS
jgi:hypothetical protein